MKCPICGTEMVGTSYCPNCGYSLDKDIATNGEDVFDLDGSFIKNNGKNKTSDDNNHHQ